tara:strand:+ start:217 stop:552 length:336 start_codon:yes stop_codon:yes gene_type:complete
MPLINITTSKKVLAKQNLLEGCSKLLANLTCKPEKFVMVLLNESIPMHFAGNDSPCCFAEIKSIGSIDPDIMAKSISEYLSSELQIPVDRIYLNFEDIKASMWAWNGYPFG